MLFDQIAERIESTIKMRRLAVLMTVHNRKERTVHCLDCLFDCLVPNCYSFDVFITDDGCTDGTADVVRNLYPDVNIVHGDGNLYWNRGMWVAWNVAAKGNYDFYLWLNDDTYLYPIALEELISESVSHDDKAIIVGTTENSEKTAITYGGYVGGERQTPQGNSIEVEYFNGNVVLIPRYVYEKLGNLDYYFRHSKGDFDYGMRAKETGIKMYQVDEFLGICEHHTVMGDWCNPDLPLKKRWNSLYLPNSVRPNEVFYLNFKHFGIVNAVFHYISVYTRCLFPSLWIKKGKL